MGASTKFFFDSSRGDLAPDQIDVAGADQNGQRSILQYLRWSKPAFVSGDTFTHAFFLNTEGGTYLDGSGIINPAGNIATTMPGAFYLQNRLLDPIDQKRFGVAFLEPELIQSNEIYSLNWIADAGDAITDTAGINEYIGTSWCEQWFCVNTDTECEINPVTWGIKLPDPSIWKKPYQCESQSAAMIFMAYIRR